MVLSTLLCCCVQQESGHRSCRGHRSWPQLFCISGLLVFAFVYLCCFLCLFARSGAVVGLRLPRGVCAAHAPAVHKEGLFVPGLTPVAFYGRCLLAFATVFFGAGAWGFFLLYVLWPAWLVTHALLHVHSAWRSSSAADPCSCVLGSPLLLI